VSTPHGRAVITGTAFDLKVADNGTTLVVIEGTVRFESQEGFVEVTAGQISEIVGHLTPTKPISCNAAKLTAWAIDYESTGTLAHVETVTETYDITDLPLFVTREPIDHESISYERWIEQKREWFKQQFPWIFQLKEALAKEGIKVDYLQLLIQSGDIWQFVCLETVPVRFSAPTFDSLLKTAFSYGFDKQWLQENVSAAKYAMEKPVLSKNTPTGLKAFEQWLRYVDGKEQPPTPLYSLYASKYLAETRSLIWFAMRDNQYDLTDEERIEVLVLLQEEITMVCKYQNNVLCPWDKNPCDDVCRGPADNVVIYIETMKVIEEKIAEYEIRK
jgi:hypothetical protein